MNIIMYHVFIYKNLITQFFVDEDDQNSRTKSQLLGEYLKKQVLFYFEGIRILFEAKFSIMQRINIIQ